MDLHGLRAGLTFDDVLIVPRRSGIRSRADVSLATSFSPRLEIGIPVVAANMDTVCEHEMALAMARLGGLGVIHRFMRPEAQADQVARVKAAAGTLAVAAAVGTADDMSQRAKLLVDAGADALVLDIAHGHSDHAIAGVARLKSEFPDVDVVAGNVATHDGAVDLVEAGADAVKVGVGPGGACTTRTVAGVGVPQLSAIADVAEVGVPVIADGGIRNSGDIAKALAAGASTVMIGSLFAGTKETPGEVEQGPSGLQKRIRGMASFEAMAARAARQGEDLDEEYLEHRAPEGVEGTVPYRGEVSKLVNQLMAGVRSAMSYTNARDLPEFREVAEFVGVTALGYAENTPHATTGRALAP
ncbi:MAG TPA: guanosine monophosphate reductase [Acidimicrobiaceae bacterium]|nr:guanosine monophosphate reductase [Acidimicrobiaceae bacterium]HCB37982.1 guanosine monophosphate reductase [Acidimicrobiaceae bacterium]